MWIHPDLVGDMLIAALLDAFPDHATGLLATISVAPGLSKVVCKRTPYSEHS
jgi:hypothetical protein